MKVGNGVVTLKDYLGNDIHISGTEISTSTNVNETVSNSASGTLIVTGGGNDSITNSGSNVTIRAGSDNDTVKNSGANTLIDAGGGSDFVSVSASATVIGGAGNDTIQSSATAGVLYKYENGDGYDVIQGATAKDTISIVGGSWNAATVGNDVVIEISGYENTAQTGAITLTGGKGKAFKIVPTGKFINNSTTKQLITGTEDNDTIKNTATYVTVNAGSGNDSLYNYNGDYSLIDMGEGDDTVSVYDNDGVTLKAGGGNDSISGSFYSSRIFGEAGDDYIYVSGGSSNTIDGGAGADTIRAYGGSINGGDGDDEINFLRNDYSATVTGGKGDDLIKATVSDSYSYSRRYQYAAGDGNDTIYGFSANDMIQITEGTFSTLKSGNDIILSVGSGSITLKDVCAEEYYRVKILDANGNIITINNWNEMLGTDGNDTLKNNVLNVTVNALAGNDSISNVGSNVTILGGAGADTISNTGYSAKIYGGEGNDSVYSSSYATIDGGEGDDTIIAYYGEVYSGAGADKISLTSTHSCSTVSGGKGDDTIYAVAPSSSYVRIYEYSEGDGDDIIVGFTNYDSLLIVASSYSTQKSGSDAIVSVGSGSITLKNAASKTLHIKNVLKYGTTGDDKLTNSESYMRVYGLEGNDTIKNTGYYSQIYGGEGNDSIYNTGGNSTLFGGDGNDTITNAEYDVSISGGAGNDSIFNNYGYVTIDGGDGDDTIYTYNNYSRIDGGAGNDKISLYSYDYGNTVSGGAGNDTVYFSGDYGRVYQYAQGDGSDTIYGFRANDTLNITSGTFSTLKSGNDIIVNVGSGAITLKNICTSDYYRVNILGANGSMTVINPWKVMLGTNGNDELHNVVNNVTISALDGKDYISNYGRGVSISGGAGADYVYNSGTSVTIDTGADNDTVYSYSSYGKVSLGAGNDYLYSDSSATIDGGDGDDTIKVYGGSIVGGAGNDSIYFNSKYSRGTVSGGKGDDTISAVAPYSSSYVRIYEYTEGDGNDVITGFSAQDTLKITASGYSTQKSGSDLVVNVGAGKITLKNAASISVKIALDTIPAPSVADTINNTVSSTLISTGAGDDFIFNYGDSVTIDSGADDDFVDNRGADAFIVLGMGDDTIVNIGENSKIELGDGDDFIENDASRITISGGAGNDSITGGGNYASISSGAGNDTVLSDGRGWYSTISGGDGDDFISAQGNYEVVNGDAGNDFIEKYGSYATISGGAGNDTIEIVHNYYSNVFSYADGDGSDVIVGYNVNDSLQIEGEYIVERDGGDVVISVGEGSIVLAEFSADTLRINGSIVTVDGGEDEDDSTITGTARADNLTNSRDSVFINALGGSDVITNSGSNVTINGGTGDDVIINSGSGNVYEYSSGDGDDVIYGYDAEDSLQIDGDFTAAQEGGDIVIQIDGGSIVLVEFSADTLNVNGEVVSVEAGENWTTTTGTAKADRLTNSKDYVVINALGGNDTITNSGSYISIAGGAGNDVISLVGGEEITVNGGAGNDSLYSDDTGYVYQYGSGDGKDVITGFSENDTIQLTSGSLSSTLMSGANLILNVGAGSITLKNVAGGMTFTLIESDDTVTEITVPSVVNLTARADEYTNEDDDFTVYALGGNDTVDNYGVNVKISGDAGNDYLYNAGENSVILGESGNDTIENFAQDSTISGGAGNDYLYSEGENAWILGEAGNDTIENFGEYATITAGAGNDTIYNESENTLYRYGNGDGKDLIVGFSENDTLEITSGTIKSTSSRGTDVILNVGSGSITLTDAAGKTVNIMNAAGTVTSTVFSGSVVGTARSDTLENEYDNFGMSGLGGADKISNSGFGVTIDGGTGSDYITNTGSDTSILGGSGNDTIENTGEDVTITGGKGNDVIDLSVASNALINYASGDGRDVIYGFGEGDTLKITSGSVKSSVQSGDATIITVGTGKITLWNTAGLDLTIDNNFITASASLSEIVSSNYAVTDIEADSSFEIFAQADKNFVVSSAK